MQNKGFTIVELLITLTIAALLLAIAAPAFSGWTNKQRLRTGRFLSTIMKTATATVANPCCCRARRMPMR